MKVAFTQRKEVSSQSLFSSVYFAFLIFFLIVSSSLFAQQKITGRVAAGDTALLGVTVSVKGSAVSTQTDADGNFTINASPKATLVFSSVGFNTQEMAVNNRSIVNVQLKGGIQQLNEVVVVGYGVTKKATLTGAVSTVKGREIVQSPATNVSNSLVGRLPGLTAVTGSGEPGYDGSTLRIRGLNTLNNNDVLVVVDGIPGRSLERIDPNSIESVTILIV